MLLPKVCVVPSAMLMDVVAAEVMVADPPDQFANVVLDSVPEVSECVVLVWSKRPVIELPLPSLISRPTRRLVVELVDCPWLLVLRDVLPVLLVTLCVVK